MGVIRVLVGVIRVLVGVIRVLVAVIRILVGVIRRPGREAGTQAKDGERAGHFGAGSDCEVALPARDSGFPAGMTEVFGYLSAGAASTPSPHRYAASASGGVGSPLNHRHATRLLGKRMIQMVAMMIRK